MHELGIAQEIISLIEAEQKRRDYKRIVSVHLRLGALSGVDPDALTFGYEAATLDTPLAECRLVIETVAIRGRCRNCRAEFSVDDWLFACPICLSHDVDVIQGDEMQIDHLVVE